MKKIKLNDKVNITDSFAKGYVEFRNENGLLIFKKKNMVVLDGRKTILSSLQSGSKINFTKLFCDSSTTITTSDMNFTNVPKSIINDLITTDIEFNLDGLQVFINEIDYYIDKDGVKKYKIDGNNLDLVVGDSDKFTIISDSLALNGTIIENLELLTSTMPFIKITKKLNLDDNLNNTISSLGLITNGDKLFSRLVFQPIHFTPGSTYEITYYIYF